MNNRLQQFLAAENISQSAFADIIGVARASISHIISGRNKPGFDFIESTATAFPTLNVDWLITGRGKMYSTAQTPVTTTVAIETPAPEPIVVPKPEPEPVKEPEKPASIKTSALAGLLQGSENKRTVTHITVFYDDNTYQEFK